MRNTSSIAALFPKTRRGILSATFLEPRRWWYMRELARHLQVPPSSLQRELRSLVDGGILRQKRDGKRVYFRAASDSPIFDSLRELVLKTAGLADVVRNALRPFEDRARWAFIYGSIARSREHSRSDVDLLVIGPIGLADLSGPLRKVEQIIHRPVNPTVYTREEFQEKVEAGSNFVTTLLRSKKIFLLGDPREFSRAFGKQAP